jgi:soluble lytic murein transglycosylase-like protein
MRKRLQSALMATSVIATFLCLTPTGLRAQTNSTETTGNITATTDSYGRKVYVNDEAPSSAPPKPQVSVLPNSSLVFWSVTEHCWKPVPKANIRAARSAAAEVNQYLGPRDTSGSETPSTSFVRGRPFTQEEVDAAIDKAAVRHNVDPNLVRAMIKVESNFNPNAVSRKGAMGLMQLMPQTARQLKVANPFDPLQNVDAGVRHLKKLIENYGGDLKLSLAAYNAGTGAVARSAGVPRFRETRSYVNRITQLYYSGSDLSSRILGSPVHEPVRVQRNEKGVLYISNTD